MQRIGALVLGSLGCFLLVDSGDRVTGGSETGGISGSSGTS